MNAIATIPTGGQVMSPMDVAARFSAVADNMGAAEGSFLKFDGNSGDFTFGSDQTELPHGTQIAADLMNFARGYICWVEGEVKEEVMISILAGDPPSQSSLNDYGPYKKYDDGTSDGWSEQAVLRFRDLESGEVYTYKTTSKSGTRALGNLVKDFGRLFKQHPGETAVVEIGATSFVPKNNKKVGKKWAPNFKVVGWLKQDEVDRLVESADAAAADAKDGDGSDDPSNYEQTQAQVVEPTPAKDDTAPAGGRRSKRFG